MINSILTDSVKKQCRDCQIISVKIKGENMKNVEYKYDYDYDILVIKKLEAFVYDKTVEIDELLLDFDENNSPISLEILDASQRLNISKDSLRNIINFKISISVNEKFISLYCMFNVKVHNEKFSSSFKSSAGNYSNIPMMESEFAYEYA